MSRNDSGMLSLVDWIDQFVDDDAIADLYADGMTWYEIKSYYAPEWAAYYGHSGNEEPFHDDIYSHTKKGRAKIDRLKKALDRGKSLLY